MDNIDNTDDQKYLDALHLRMQDLENADDITLLDSDIFFFDNLASLPPRTDSVRTGFNVFTMCGEGKLQLDINGKTVQLHDHEILVCRSNVTLSNFMMSPHFEGAVFGMTDKMIQSLLGHHIALWNNAVYVKNTNLIEIDQPMQDSLRGYYVMGKTKHRLRDIPFQREILYYLLKALMLDICRLLLPEKHSPENAVLTQSKQLFNKFLQMLSSAQVKRQSVEYYASKLYITPKYLSVICRHESGKTPSEWIHQYVTEDMRYYLLETTLSVKEISLRLGFPNLSFFGKYAKHRLGDSPKNFRKKMIVRQADQRES